MTVRRRIAVIRGASLACIYGITGDVAGRCARRRDDIAWCASNAVLHLYMEDDGMRKLGKVLCVTTIAAWTVLTCAAERSKTEVARQDGRLSQSVDLLSDTQGVNFRPYMKAILSEIDDQWSTRVPEGAHPGSTEIRLTVKPDGSISEMHMDGSTKDDGLNRAAWSSLTSLGQLPPLPAKFHGANLEMRIHFVVNP
ncbi:MAG: TonB C-terminal domain-containing protein [Acidobacteria bacterium]|nr:TonB C-terminal domain-containing protein [Acidobacteriota bacterium]